MHKMECATNSNDCSTNGLPIEQARESINSADLTLVVERLVDVDGWSRKDALTATLQYRNFLFLKKKYGHKFPLPPSYEIDEVWHAHILHTKDYVEFCEIVFGYYLHHHPHLTQEASSKSELETFFEKTQALYCQEFGDYIYAIKQTPIKRVFSKFIKKFLNRETLTNKETVL